MSDYHEDFFDELRPWSRLKNRILGSYMAPYIAKVAKRRKRLVLVDAFAGAGRFSDGTVGSPLIICQAAERFAKGNYDAYFFNNTPAHHETLKSILNSKGLHAAHPILGDAIKELKDLIASLRDEVVFLYIDPYGLDCEFDVLRPLLERDKSYSTEILINLHMPISHRLGSRHTVQEKATTDTLVQSYHQKLTRVFGGVYWKDVLLSDEFSGTKHREAALIDRYREMLSSTGYLTHTGACPIREKREGATKYVMVFGSPHRDALLLLNDNMCKSFETHMHEQWVTDTMFADSSWSDWRNPEVIQDIALQYIEDYPSKTRLELWYRIIADYFMLFTKSEFGNAVKALCDTGRIECITPVKRGGPRPTKRLNDKCVFQVTGRRGLF